MQSHSNASRVLLLPPTRRDAAVLVPIFEKASLRCIVCYDAKSLSRELAAGAGAILMTDSAFNDSRMRDMWSVLSQQPAWSDIPAIVLCRSGDQSLHVESALRNLTNVTILERPTSTRTLLSTTLSALRARSRQYEMRDQLDALEASEGALKTATVELLDSNHRKDEFLAMLAHELRNPLAPILNASEVLTRVIADPSAQKTVDLLKRQASHLARLVDDLLDMSRITSGRIELRRGPVKIADVVNQACEIVEPIMREKQHRLRVIGNGSAYVDGDHARLVQCLANVLSNAAKYTDAGGEICVDLGQHNDRVSLTVTDNGIGIAPEMLPRIFDMFVQVDRSLDRSQGGLGIGLCVVKRLIEMHGGEVTASSEGLGRGTTFEISLPLIEAPQVAKVHAQRPTARAKRVLVVDDNRDSASSLALLLELEGHRSKAVFSAEEALHLAALEHPDTVVLDIGLPDLDGYEVAKRVRALCDNVQLIALTGYGRPEDVQRADRAGFDAHLIKPVDFDRLVRLIGEFRMQGGAERNEASAVSGIDQPYRGTLPTGAADERSQRAQSGHS